MRITFIAAVLLAVGVGCAARVSYIPLNGAAEPRASVSPEQVQVFHSKPPTQSYVEVALVEVQERELGDSSPETLFRKMREAAAAKGCEGLILTGPNDASYGLMTGELGQLRTLQGYRATCIVFADAARADAGTGR